MIPLLRTLEAWTAHQDYFWFLGMLAWLGVAYGGTRSELFAGKRQPWLVLLGAMFALICALEIAMFATSVAFKPPYLWWDLCFGLALGAAIAALLQPLLDTLPGKFRPAASVGGAAAIVGLVLWRWWDPQNAGFLLALLAAAGVLWLLRATSDGIGLPGATAPEQKLFRAALVLLALFPAVADFGPFAYFTDDSRRYRDLSRFALLAAILCGVGGACVASMLWRRYLRSSAWSEQSRRDLRLAFRVLGLWLGIGFFLTLGSGWLARRSFERNALLRLENAAAALDAEQLKIVLGPQLKLEELEQHTTRGMPGLVPTMRINPTFMGKAPFDPLAEQLRRLDALDPDFNAFQILTIRDGYLFAPVSTFDRPTRSRVVTRPDGTSRTVRTVYSLRSLHREATIEDCVELQEKEPVFDRPSRVRYRVSIAAARVPLVLPGSRVAVGWLSARMGVGTWNVTFASARFQTMLIVSIGVALWGTAVGYRLRREGREQAERLAREAGEADRAKSEFLAHVSHELRTPIQSVLGYAELLAAAPLSQIEHQRLGALRSQGDLLLRLVNDLIDLGALQAGVFRLQPTLLDAAALTRECLDTIRPQAGAKQLALHLELAPTAVWVEVDGQRLRQILINLLGNAVKFTPHGDIWLTMARPADAENIVEWTVRDSGPGIDPEDQARIFEPFERLERDHAITGAGMGLTLCARLCRAMNGTVTVHSDGEHGTTFTVRLPLPARASGPLPALHALPAVPAGPHGTTWQGLRVLVADDNTLVRELLATFFREHGAQAAAVPDGLAVVEACADRDYDVIVLDLSMPWLDGRETARRLRRPGATLGRPWIIGLSAHAGREDAESALAAGMDRFLTKPISLAQLAAALAEAPTLGSRSAAGRVSCDAHPELLRRLLAQFLSETPAIVAEMRAAFASQDRPRLRARAHYLKNSADVLGASELRQACHVLYLHADSAEAAALGEMLATVESTARLPNGAETFSPDSPA